MFFKIKSYTRFLWHSKNEHAVHSPFVFHLITKCFYDFKPKPDYKILKEYRKTLSRNKKTIEVTDFGAGSKVFVSNVRAINKIVQTAGISAKRAELLFRVVSYFKPKTVLELGTSLGLATTALSLGNSKAAITSLEGCQNTLEVTKKMFEEYFPNKNYQFLNTEFDSFLENQKSSSKASYDLIYFDGNHSKEATLRYFESLLPTASNDTVWVFDDIHWSAGMEEAWEAIKKHPKVSVTIDTFQWGFVFFRREQPKEHFTIRI